MIDQTSIDSTREDLQRDFRYQLSVHGIYMIPDGAQATDYSRPGFGGGATIIFPIGSLPDIMRAGAGIEVVSLMSKSIEFMEPTTGLPFDQETNQIFWRIYGGLHVGTRGPVLFRPYGALNLALEIHRISTEVIVKDQDNPTIEIRKTTHSDSRVVAGCDMTFGLDINVSKLLALDGGFRFVKSFAVPQQLGEGSVKIYPHYFQIFLGVRAQGLAIP